MQTIFTTSRQCTDLLKPNVSLRCIYVENQNCIKNYLNGISAGYCFIPARAEKNIHIDVNYLITMLQLNKDISFGNLQSCYYITQNDFFKNPNLAGYSLCTNDRKVPLPIHYLNPGDPGETPANVKYIMFIQNCLKYNIRKQIQKSTWIPLIPESIYVFHIFGKPGNYIFDDNTLAVPTGDEYEHLPEKFQSACKFILHTFLCNANLIGVLKLDDDIHLLVPRLLYLLQNMQGDYAGFKSSFPGGYHNYGHDQIKDKGAMPKEGIYYPRIEFCVGGFLYFSKKAIDAIVSETELFKLQVHDDFLIGMCLKKSNILPTHIERLWTFNLNRPGFAMYIVDRKVLSDRKYTESYEEGCKLYEHLLLINGFASSRSGRATN